MLEFGDIQHILLTRAPALTARYEFLSFRDGAGGRTWVSAIKETIYSAASMRAGIDKDRRWVTAAFTWNGLRALGLDEGSLASFPEEFKQGMVAGPETLGDGGSTAPEHWVGGLASPDLHAIVILFARDDAEHDRCVLEHERLIADCPGVEVLSVLDLKAIPPLDYAHDHFGYRDRLSQPVIEGQGEEPTPGSGDPLKAGEFILGYPDEYDVIADNPQPKTLAQNGSYMAYRRLAEHVGKFRDFLRQHGETTEEQELIAAKLMGRWRSGAPLVLSPEQRRSRSWGPIRNGTTTSTTRRWILKGMRSRSTPPCAPMNRATPRRNMNRRRMIRRGATYGPQLPEGKVEDGVDRGIAAFITLCESHPAVRVCAERLGERSDFHELGNERDPIVGAQDGTLEFKIPKRPIRKKIVGLPAFTTVRGGAYFFLPGLKALGYLASLTAEGQA